MRKPTGKIFSLPEEQQAQIAEWLLNGIPYHQVQALVEKEYQVRIDTKGFVKFWQEVCGPALLARRARAVGLSQDIASDARKSPGSFDEATIAAISQKAFELAVSPGAKAADVKRLFDLVLKAKDQTRDQKALDLAQKEFDLKLSKYKDEVAEKKQKIEESLNALKSQGGISPETLRTMEEAVNLL